jgi:hypothetical protein
LPQGKSDESNNRLCFPNGLAQSLLVEPNSASVGVFDTHAKCIKPESSDKTSFIFFMIANPSVGF